MIHILLSMRFSIFNLPIMIIILLCFSQCFPEKQSIYRYIYIEKQFKRTFKDKMLCVNYIETLMSKIPAIKQHKLIPIIFYSKTYIGFLKPYLYVWGRHKFLLLSTTRCAFISIGNLLTSF